MTPPPSSARSETVSPDSALGLFSAARLKRGVWPAWIVAEWEEGYLQRRWIGAVWDTIVNADPAAERIVHVPLDAATTEIFLTDVGQSSLFAGTRLLIAHLSRPTRRFLKPATLALQIDAAPAQTVLVVTVEGMGWIRQDVEMLKKAVQPSERPGFLVSIWKPFPEKLPAFAREILMSHNLRVDEPETLRFWIDRVGSSLDRFQAETIRLKSIADDGVVSRKILEDVFEEPHVHDKTVWIALQKIFRGEIIDASADLHRLLQATDTPALAARVSHALRCVQALATPGNAPASVFQKFEIKGKRKQDLLMETARILKGPIPALPSRLLELDLGLKKARTAPGRQEVLRRALLTLGGEPEPAA